MSVDPFADAFAALDTDYVDDPNELPRTMRQALSMVAKEDKFFGFFLSGMTFENDPATPILATNCADKIYYNRDRITNPPDGKEYYADPCFVACGLIHEAYHVIRRDMMSFCPGRDMRLANIALDAIINGNMINDHDFIFPGANFVKWPLALSGKFSGLIDYIDHNDTEFNIYNELKRMSERDDKGAGDPLVKRWEQAQGNKQGDDGDPSDGNNNGPGTGAGNDLADDMNRAGYDDACARMGGPGGVEAYVIQAVATAHALAAKAEAQEKQNDPQGDAPDGSSEAGNGKKLGNGFAKSGDDFHGWLQDMGLRRRIARNPLANAAGSKIRRALMTAPRHKRRSYMVHNKLSQAYGYVLAGRKSEPNILPAIGLDCSGSVKPIFVAQAVAEAQSWVKPLVRNGRVPIAFFNHKIMQSGDLGEFSIGRNVPRPGGGTSFQAVVDWAASLPRRPTHLLVWTDCQCSMPDLPPGMQIIWITPQAEASNHKYYQLKGELVISE